MDRNVQNMDTQTTQQGEAGNQQQEKLFTQEDVNRIVQDRLARAKSQPDDSVSMADREQQLNQRELRLNAREKLADAGIAKELLPLVNCNSEKDIEESIRLIGAHFTKEDTGNVKSAQVPKYRIVTTGGNSDSGSGSSKGDDEIRSAMGLKGR